VSFSRLIHADWSVSPNKRWAARACYTAPNWTVEAVEPVGDCSLFARSLVAAALDEAVLAGFDFPIGVPEVYGKQTGLKSFPDLLQQIGQGRWSAFDSIARETHEISLERPFYPAGAAAGLKQADLLNAHGAAALDDLRRSCERQTEDRRAACPLFWTLGGNQVGRAALAGWVEVLKPTLAAGARLWPFDGSLAILSKEPGLVLAETYPAEAYGHVGVAFGNGESKTRQIDRAGKSAALLQWADENRVELSPAVEALILDGFGSDKAGEDRFDALLGLCGMIEVVSGRRSEGSHSNAFPWEGWILGQRGTPSLRSTTPAITPLTELDLHRATAVADFGVEPETARLLSDLLQVWNSVHQGMPVIGPWMEARLIHMIRGWVGKGWCVSGPTQVCFPGEPDLRSRSWDIVIHRPVPNGYPPEAAPGAGYPLVPLEAVQVVIDTKTNFNAPATYSAQACFNLMNDCSVSQVEALGDGVTKLVLAATSSRGADSMLREGAAHGVPTFAMARYSASPVQDAGERKIEWRVQRFLDGTFPLQAFKFAVLSGLRDPSRPTV
jgi:hypothetical protein